MFEKWERESKSVDYLFDMLEESDSSSPSVFRKIYHLSRFFLDPFLILHINVS